MQQEQGFSDDRPIKAAAQDELHRDEFSKRLTRGLTLNQHDASLVIGLEAPWGWGKTSLINLARHHLAAENAIVIDFSPWLVGARDSLINSFLIQLAASIQVKDRPKEGKDAAEQLLKYSAIFNVMKLIPGAEPWASITHNVVRGVGKAARDISQLKQLDMENQRKRVTDALAKIGRPIVVIVDDLDRLPPQEVFEILRFVKAVADFNRVAYLLAYDHTHIERALHSVGIPDGAGYLEKIVQVRLHLPPASPSDARAFLESRLIRFNYEEQAAIFPRVHENVADVYVPYLRRLLVSPRAIVRVMNRLEVSYRMTDREVVFGDLLGLESLAILAPSIYEAIKAQPERFLGTEELSLSEHLDEKKTAEKTKELRRELLDGLQPSYRRRDIAGLLEKLFPSEMAYAAASPTELRKNGHIGEISRLRIALNLGVLSNDVSFDQVRAFVTSPGDRFAIIASLPSDRQLIERFIELLGDFVEGVDVADPESYALALATLLQRPEFENEGAVRGPSSIDRDIAACLELAVKSTPVSSKKKIYFGVATFPAICQMARHALNRITHQERGAWHAALVPR